MPGHGVKWNEDISKDWGGKAIEDYLSAIDDISKRALSIKREEPLSVLAMADILYFNWQEFIKIDLNPLSLIVAYSI